MWLCRLRFAENPAILGALRVMSEIALKPSPMPRTMRRNLTLVYCAPTVLTAIIFASSFAQRPSAKPPIPDEAAQKEAMAVIKEVYKADYDKAKTAEQKVILAKKLLKDAIATKDDPVGGYVLLRVAKDIASAQGDLDTAFLAIGTAAGRYDVDTLKLKVTAVTEAFKATRQPKDHEQLIQKILPVLDKSIVEDRYDLSNELVAIAVPSSRAARNGEILKRIAVRSKEVEEIEREFKRTAAALELLKTKSTDAEANLTVGRFRCFVKNDWETGMPHLALGSDGQLKELSAKELADKPDALALGDSWWDLAEKEEGLAKDRIRTHAADWYREALPGLSGLGKAKVDKRLADVGPNPGKKTLPKRTADSSSGKVVSKEPAPPSEPLAKSAPSRWINESYDCVTYHVKDKQWAELDNKTKKIKWYYSETARTPEYVELFNETRKETVRFFAKRAEFMKGGKWEWISNGHWDSPKP